MENNLLITILDTPGYALVAPGYAMLVAPGMRCSVRPGLRSNGMIRNAPCIIQEKGMKSSAFSRGFESTRERFHAS